MKILKVNMSEGKIDSMPVPEGKVLGGRGMIDHLMTEYGSATAHPLSPEALFVAAIGILGGTAAPNAHRISVGGKSPLTGGIKEANAGGVAAHKLGRLGIQAAFYQRFHVIGRRIQGEQACALEVLCFGQDTQG